MEKNKLSLLFKLSNKFIKRYLKEYFMLLLKPVIIGIIGTLSILLAFISPELAIVSLFISIPCACYGFWKGYLITYSLNIAAYNFITKNASVSLKDCYQKVVKDEKQFAMYVLFYAFVIIIGYLPTSIFAYLSLANTDITALLTDPLGIFSATYTIGIIFIINSLILLPFMNYSLQAYTFKQNENFIKLFLNCYKKLDLTGFIIAVIVSVLCFIVSAINILLYVLTFIFINLFVYSINTFWYYSKVKIKEN